MDVNVNELTGMALDWAVGMAIGKPLVIRSPIGQPSSPRMVWEQVGDHGGVVWIAPSGNWAHGGPLIDRYTVDRDVLALNRGVRSKCWSDGNGEEVMGYPAVVGPTALIAACRAIVVAMIGPVVNVPDELL